MAAPSRVTAPPGEMVSVATPEAAATASGGLAVVVPVSVSLALPGGVTPIGVSPIGVSRPMAFRLQTGLPHNTPLFDLQSPSVHVTPEIINGRITHRHMDSFKTVFYDSWCTLL